MADLPPLPARHYIVVVHGIGRQKLNETTTLVVQRFAEARNSGCPGHSEDGRFETVLPPHLSAQSMRQGAKGHGWSEFEGIPITKPADDCRPFHWRAVESLDRL